MRRNLDCIYGATALDGSQVFVWVDDQTDPVAEFAKAGHEVADVRQVSQDYVAEIMAASQPPETVPSQPNVTGVSAEKHAELEAIKAENEELSARLSHLEARMGAFFEGVEEAVRKT